MTIYVKIKISEPCVQLFFVYCTGNVLCFSANLSSKFIIKNIIMKVMNLEKEQVNTNKIK